MSFSLLFKDELKGFYKSKVMIFLWIGLPLMTILIHLWYPDTGGAISLTALSAIVVSSLGGTLAAVMLTVSIIHEKTRHVYDLFLIRPIKRWKLIISKFLAVYTCIVIASLLAIILGTAIDYFSVGLPQEAVLNNALQSFAISISMMAVSSAAGTLIGVAAPSVLVGVILVIYGGNQISSIPLIPNILKISNTVPLTIMLGGIISCVLLAISVLVFNKKQF
jgi:ABC-2 type transport system permease protein